MILRQNKPLMNACLEKEKEKDGVYEIERTERNLNSHDSHFAHNRMD